MGPRFERLLLFLWRELPLPSRVRRAYLTLSHPTFLLGVMALIQDERGRTLTLYHTYRRDHPWGLPGGYLNAREAPEVGLRRELREELGIELQVGELLAVGLYSPDQLDLLYRARIVSGEPRASNEIRSWRWSDQEALREILPNQAQMLRRAGILNKQGLEQ